MVATSFFLPCVPSLSSCTSAEVAPDAPFVTLDSSTTERLKSVAEAISRASMLPFHRTRTVP